VVVEPHQLQGDVIEIGVLMSLASATYICEQQKTLRVSNAKELYAHLKLLETSLALCNDKWKARYYTVQKESIDALTETMLVRQEQKGQAKGAKKAVERMCGDTEPIDGFMHPSIEEHQWKTTRGRRS
jgi:hypothetical protein